MAATLRDAPLCHGHCQRPFAACPFVKGLGVGIAVANFRCAEVDSAQTGACRFWLVAVRMVPGSGRLLVRAHRRESLTFSLYDPVDQDPNQLWPGLALSGNLLQKLDRQGTIVVVGHGVAPFVGLTVSEGVH